MACIVGSHVSASVPGIRWDDQPHRFAGTVLAIVGNRVTVSCDGGESCPAPSGMHSHDVRASTVRPVITTN